MTDANFMDELFQRIHDLESENKILENNIKTVQVELEMKELNNLIEYKEETDIIKEIELLNEKEGESEIIKVNSNLKEISLEFVPFDNFKEVYIAGDFTNWNRLLLKNVLI
jgi:hypothetical protein